MKKILLYLAAFAAIVAATPAGATTPGTAATATNQQNRMKTCAAQYHQKKLPKSQYKTFMNGCLKTSAPTKTSVAPAKPAVTPTAAPAPAANAPSTMTPPTTP